MGSPREDAFRPAKLPGIVSKAPNAGSGGIFAQNVGQPGRRCQEWGTGLPVPWLPRGSLRTWGQLSVTSPAVSIAFIFPGLPSDWWGEEFVLQIFLVVVAKEVPGPNNVPRGKAGGCFKGRQRQQGEPGRARGQQHREMTLVGWARGWAAVWGNATKKIKAMAEEYLFDELRSLNSF